MDFFSGRPQGGVVAWWKINSALRAAAKKFIRELYAQIFLHIQRRLQHALRPVFQTGIFRIAMGV